MRTWAILLVACGAAAPPVRLTEDWPDKPGGYAAITDTWTRRATLRGQYQEALTVVATFKSPDWRAAHAEREADNRKLEGDARVQVIAQAKADMAGPYELEMLATCWNRNECDFDRGKRSIWRTVLIDDQDREIEPLEIVKDKRPQTTIREQFPGLEDFANAYVVRFPRTTPVLGPGVHAIRLRISSERGGVELTWTAK
jgi:hypothetical protein